MVKICFQVSTCCACSQSWTSFWSDKLKVEKEIRVLFFMLLFWLELYRCFLNLESHSSIKSILKKIISPWRTWTVTFLRNCNLWKTTSMIQRLSCLLIAWFTLFCLEALRPSSLLFMKLVNGCLGKIAFEPWSYTASLNRCGAVPSVREFLNWISYLLPWKI